MVVRVSVVFVYLIKKFIFNQRLSLKNINLNVPGITKMEVDDILLVRTDPDSDKSTLSYIEKKWIEHIYGELPSHKDSTLKNDKPTKKVPDTKSKSTVEEDPSESPLEDSPVDKSVVVPSLNNNYIKIMVLAVIYLALHLIRLPAKFDNISTRTIIFVLLSIVVFNII